MESNPKLRHSSQIMRKRRYQSVALLYFKSRRIHVLLAVIVALQLACSYLPAQTFPLLVDSDLSVSVEVFIPIAVYLVASGGFNLSLGDFENLRRRRIMHLRSLHLAIFFAVTALLLYLLPFDRISETFALSIFVAIIGSSFIADIIFPKIVNWQLVLVVFSLQLFLLVDREEHRFFTQAIWVEESEFGLYVNILIGAVGCFFWLREGSSFSQI